MSRINIPRQLAREVLLEAGHRCAIPTCRSTPVEIAHIKPYAEVKEHKFDNLIALCPNCHSRHHKGEIDRKSLRQYKANLSVLNSRYGDFERRILLQFATQPGTNVIKLPGGNLIFLLYLIEDGYLEHIGHSEGHNDDEFPNFDLYYLTENGQEFITKWLNAEQLQ
ncbi:MAG: HNH endonuclease [Anaerolineae bacterium]|nr:HNH endonuclease [Anaerolineae bacterium]